MANLMNNILCQPNQSNVMMCELCKTVFKSQELFENHLRQESHLVKLKSVPGLCKFCKICKLHYYYNVITKQFEDHKNSPAHLWATAITVFGNHKVIANLFWLKPGPSDKIENNSNFLGKNYIIKCVGKGKDYYICYLCGFSPKIESCCNEYLMEDSSKPLIVHHLQSKWHLRNLMRVHAPRYCKNFDKLYAKEENDEILKVGHFSKVKQSKIAEKVTGKIYKFIPPHLLVNKRICNLNISKCSPDYDMIAHVITISNKILTEINLFEEDKGEAIKILRDSISEQFGDSKTNQMNLGVDKYNFIARHNIKNDYIKNEKEDLKSIEVDKEKMKIAPNADEQPFVFPTTAIEDMVVLDEISTVATTSTHWDANNSSFELGNKEPHENSLSYREVIDAADKGTIVDDVRNVESLNKEDKPNFYVRSKIGKDGRRTVVVKKICKPKHDLYRWKRPGYTPPLQKLPLTITTTNVNAKPKDRIAEIITSAQKRSLIQKERPAHMKISMNTFGNNQNDPDFKPDDLTRDSSSLKALVNVGNQRLLNEVLTQVQQYVPGMPSVDMTKEDFTKESTIWRLLDVVSNIIKTLIMKPFDKNKLTIFFDKLQAKYCKTLKVDNCYLHNLLRGILISFNKDLSNFTGNDVDHHEALLDVSGFNNFPSHNQSTSFHGSLMQSNPGFPPFPPPLMMEPFVHYDINPFSIGANPLTPAKFPSSNNWFDNEKVNSTHHHSRGDSHGKSRSKERSQNHHKKRRRYRSRRHRIRRSKSSDNSLQHREESSRGERHLTLNHDHEIHAKPDQHIEKGSVHPIVRGESYGRVEVSNKSLEDMPDERCLLQRSLLANRLKQLIELQNQALAPKISNEAGSTDDSMSIAVHLQTRLNDIVSDPGNASALHGPGGADVKGLLQEALRTQVKLLEKNNDRMRVMESSSHVVAQATMTQMKKTYTPLSTKASTGPTYGLGVNQASIKNDYGSKNVLKAPSTKRYFTAESKPASIGTSIPVHHTFHKYREDVSNDFKHATDASQSQVNPVSHNSSGNSYYENKNWPRPLASSHYNYPPPVYNPTPLINSDMYREVKDVIPHYYTDNSKISSNPSVYDPNPNLAQYFTNFQREDNAHKYATPKSGTFQNFFK